MTPTKSMLLYRVFLVVGSHARRLMITEQQEGGFYTMHNDLLSCCRVLMEFVQTKLMARLVIF